ncbi:alpha/beta hydrolase [Oceanibium sediminis]|uniref:alpha/beta hydrolase n=1 Tax=Oceanibium sediminis TaxID=2026339 RepID=UPI000DD486F6|nr:alpha/beta hydrolase [Oceanibium sediminis]
MQALALLTGLLSLALALGLLGAATGAFLDPASTRLAVVGGALWAPFGPHLLLAALAALGLAGITRRWGARRAGALALGLSAGATLCAGYIVARLLWVTVAAGGSVNLIAALVPGPMDSPPPDKEETFRTVAGTTLRAAIYVPPESATPAPVLVYIHGGGFKTGHRTETAADLRWFADRGWLVVSVDYRLFTPGMPTWDKAMPDAACGLTWAARNAPRLGGDPARIALSGDSAGGNLAINIGFAAAERLTVPGCGPVLAPAAIVTQYPAVDPTSIHQRGYPIPGFTPKELIEGYIGGPPDRHPERIAAIDSRNFLTAKAPPTQVILPLGDSLVVAEGTLEFAEAARAAGVPLELVRLPFANHVFNQIGAQTLGNQAGRTIRLRFLDQHLR